MFVRLLIAIILQGVIMAAMLFLPAGTWHWWRGWVMVAVYTLGIITTLLLVFPGREDLLRERMKPLVQEGQPFADKIAVLLFLATYIAVIVFTPLDVFRLHWFPKPPVWVSGMGMGLFVAGWTIISLVFKENPFAAPVVKYQPERHQKVIDTGVYQVVRHPMYTGFAGLSIGMALWLESYGGALASLIPIGILAVRILIEERFLKQSLEGYAAYTQRVRYRLIPYIW